MKGSVFNKVLFGTALVLVVIAGFTVFGKGSSDAQAESFGGTLAGSPASYNTAVQSGDVQTIETTLDPRGYPDLVVQKGVPVRWNFKADASALNSCNNALIIPEFNIEKKLQPGDNIIEFTPTETGAIPYSCWMGMISATIRVVDDTSNVNSKDLNNQEVIGAAPPRGCCSAGRNVSNGSGN